MGQSCQCVDKMSLLSIEPMHVQPAGSKRSCRLAHMRSACNYIAAHSTPVSYFAQLVVHRTAAHHTTELPPRPVTSVLPQEDAFKLQHLLDADLLKAREEVEDLAGAAVKERQIERKLDQLRAEWAVQQISFQEHKSRGAVVIKPADYAELVEKLEESQMNLSSMATNRYTKPFEAQVRSMRWHCV